MQSNPSRRLALLGGASLMGRNVAEALRTRGHAVLVLDPRLPAPATADAVPLPLAEREVADVLAPSFALMDSGSQGASFNVGSAVGHAVNEVVELVQRVAASIRWRQGLLEDGQHDFHHEFLAAHVS